MVLGRRCGCWTLSELEEERRRHKLTLEYNARLQRETQTLRDELLAVHDTVTRLERRNTDLSSRYSDARDNLNQVTSTTTALRGQSEEVTEDNRRLRATCQRLEAEVSRLREDAEGATEAAEEERLRRRASEMDLTREMEAVERSCDVELRRASSAHSLDVQHLEQKMVELERDLVRERNQHNVTRHRLQHLEHHLDLHFGPHRTPLLPRSQSHSPLLHCNLLAP